MLGSGGHPILRLAVKTEEKTIELGKPHIRAIMTLGARGCHVLFDPDMIRRALGQSPVESIDDHKSMFGAIRGAAREVLEMDDLTMQREYIQRLPEGVQNILIHLYFRALDQFAGREQHALH